MWHHASQCVVWIVLISSLTRPMLPSFPGDGVDFLSWFLNALHSALGGTKKKKKSKSCYFVKGSCFFVCFLL